MKCPECASENMDGSDRCWKCSASLRAPVQTGGTSWIIWLVVGAVGVLLVGMLMIAGRTSGGGSSSGALPPNLAPSTAATSSTPAAAPATTAVPAPSKTATKPAGKK